jgi:hypothetical protein
MCGTYMQQPETDFSSASESRNPFRKNVLFAWIYLLNCNRPGSRNHRRVNRMVRVDIDPHLPSIGDLAFEIVMHQSLAWSLKLSN